MKRQTATVDCPKSMVGRVIGKQGETIKALQNYTGALIQIDQTIEPTRVTISGTPHSLSLAISMVTDIVKGTFKGFALLRQLASPTAARAGALPGFPQPRPVYAPGYGLIPPSQLYGGDDGRSPYVLSPTHMQMMSQGKKAAPWPGQVPGSPMMMGMQGLGLAPPVQRPMGRFPGMEQGMGPAMGLDAAAYAMAGIDPSYYPQASMMQQPLYMLGGGLDGMGLGAQGQLFSAASKGHSDGTGVGWPPNDGDNGNALVNDLVATSSPVSSGDMVQMMMPEGYYMNPVPS